MPCLIALINQVDYVIQCYDCAHGDAVVKVVRMYISILHNQYIPYMQVEYAPITKAFTETNLNSTQLHTTKDEQQLNIAGHGFNCLAQCCICTKARTVNGLGGQVGAGPSFTD